MNLVYVANVVSAIAFLVEIDGGIGREVFIVSDDDDPSNNYRDIEKYLMKRFGYAGYPVPRIPLPPFVLAFLLRLAGRSNRNPARVYSCEKLLKAGFRKPIAFESGLAFFRRLVQRSVLLEREAGEFMKVLNVNFTLDPWGRRTAKELFR
jgi:nucleoside-diphosphate-sugar epimerase